MDHKSTDEQLKQSVTELEQILHKTKRKLAETERQLEQGQKLLTDVLDAIPDMVWLKDANGIYLTCNQKLAVLVNSTRDKIIGSTDYDIFPSEKADFYGQYDRKAIQNKVTTINEESADYLHKGYSIWIETSKTPVYDNNGDLVGVLGIGRDISRRKQTQKESDEKQAFFNMVVDRSPIPMLICSPNWTALRANQAFCSTINLAAEQIIGKYNLLHDENLQPAMIAEKLKRVIHQKQPVHFDISWKSGLVRNIEFRSGNNLYIDVSVIPLLDQDEEITHIVVQWVDVTERKQAGKALKESEEKFRKLYENSPYGIIINQIIRDAQGKPKDFIHMQANPSTSVHLGMNLTELVGTKATEIADEKTAATFIHKYGEVVRTGTPCGFEYYFSHHDRTLWVTAFHLTGDYFITTFTDISERKLAEQRVEHLNRVLRSIRDVNQLIVREHDPEKLIRKGCRLLVDNRGYTSALILLKDEDNRVTTWSGSGLAYASDRLNEMLSHGEAPPCCGVADHSTHVIVINDRPGVCGSCPISVDASQLTSYCTRLVHGGQTFGYLIAALDTHIEADEEELGLFSEIAGDLAYALSFMRLGAEHKTSEHKRKNLESQLFQAQKMESVGRLAGGVAHDFNNMLSIIIGYSESALEKLDSENPLVDDLTEIYKAGKRSADITRQLLAFARQQTSAPKVLALNQNIEGMLKMLRRLIGEDIDLSWQPGAELWPVKMDPSQIDQILANLCVNARDAIKEVGQITIETKNITFDQEYCADHPGFIPGDYVRLAVSDSGSGMAPETLDKIFEPFYTTKNLQQGTGLGLSTVYGIIKQNKGFINVYSELERGTTIKSYLPRFSGQTAAMPIGKTSEIPLSRGETILLVEDDKSILKLGEKMLNRFGYTVLSASTPKEAIRIVEAHPNEISLLITDVVMPEMNGRELSDRLQHMQPGLKTLYMSGYTANVIAHRGVLDDGVVFIPKPLSKKELSVKVREALGATNDLE